MTAILLLSCALSSDKRLFSGPETGQEKAEALREFRRSSFGALTRGFPKRTDFSFDAIFSTPASYESVRNGTMSATVFTRRWSGVRSPHLPPTLNA